MRIALFGGTFNPVHYGHLLIAQNALEEFELDRIVFIPAGLPPHKNRLKTSSAHRLAMLRLATRNNPAFTVSPWEIQKKRVVYTYETLEHYRRQLPKDALYFLLGSDAMQDLSHWRNSKKLRQLARFIPALRIDPFASHDIRERAKKRKSVRYLVPEAVERYIHKHRLYRTPE